jgi:P27 family predicted phage terminase small subunit
MPQMKKSTARHLLEGTEPQGKQPAQPEYVVPAGRPKPPKGMEKAAKRIFKLLAKQLAERRACTAGEAHLLALYAEKYVCWEKAKAMAAELGEVVTDTRLDSNGTAHTVLRKNPWQGIVEVCESKMHGYLRDLGLTPSAKSKIKPTGDAQPAGLPPDSVGAWLRDNPPTQAAPAPKDYGLEDFVIPEIQ